VGISIDFRLSPFSATLATTCDLDSNLLPRMALGIPRVGPGTHTSWSAVCQRSLSVPKASIATHGNSDPNGRTQEPLEYCAGNTL
jgi:hypothetical protein